MSVIPLGIVFGLAGIVGLWISLQGYYYCKVMEGKRALIPSMASSAGWAIIGLCAVYTGKVDILVLFILIVYTAIASVILFADIRRVHEAVGKTGTIHRAARPADSLGAFKWLYDCHRRGEKKSGSGSS